MLLKILHIHTTWQAPPAAETDSASVVHKVATGRLLEDHDTAPPSKKRGASMTIQISRIITMKNLQLVHYHFSCTTLQNLSVL